MKIQNFTKSIVAMAVFGFATISAHACTGLQLTAKDGSIVNGRTLEFGTPLKGSLAVVPRGYKFTGTTPEGKGMSYAAKYAAVGAFLFNQVLLMDGMNEKGLAVGTFYFPGFASYTPIRSDNQKQALSPIDFPNWIVTQFASVDEVKSALSNVVIVPTVFKEWGASPPPFHYIVYDKSGNCLVIEPVDGKLVAHDNKLGVFTNSPTFDWHMGYLHNFANLGPENAAPLELKGVKFAPFGQGSGMVGLPGDFTPPSRFVRAAFFSATALPSENADAAVLQIFHILNQFDIPLGIAREVQGGKISADFTMVTCVKDPQALKYYFKTYNDQTIRVVDLNSFDWDAKEVKKASAPSSQVIADFSSELK